MECTVGGFTSIVEEVGGFIFPPVCLYHRSRHDRGSIIVQNKLCFHHLARTCMTFLLKQMQAFWVSQFTHTILQLIVNYLRSKHKLQQAGHSFVHYTLTPINMRGTPRTKRTVVQYCIITYCISQVEVLSN